jgi:hypothetical protein
MRKLLVCLILIGPAFAQTTKAIPPSKEEVVQLATEMIRLAPVFNSATLEAKEAGLDTEKEKTLAQYLSETSSALHEHPERYKPSNGLFVSQLLNEMMTSLTADCLKVSADTITKLATKEISMADFSHKTGTLDHLSSAMLSVKNVLDINDRLVSRAVIVMEESVKN